MKVEFKNHKWRPVAIVIAVFVLLGSGAYWFSLDHEGQPHGEEQVTSGEEEVLYHCPMHPDIVQDEPGICPICHMDLQKVENHDSHAGQPPESGEVGDSGEREILYYRHPMQPDITSDVPAKDEMGMDYIPVYKDEVEAAQGSGGGVEGRAGFNLPPDRQQMIGVTSTDVTVKPLQKEIRATGRVAFDPELFTAIEEYQQALIASRQMSDSSYTSLRQQSSALAASSKVKLKLMGLTEEQIKKLASGETDAMSLILPEGKVWVYAEIFEYEMGGVEVGQKVEATAPSIPGKAFVGEISSISPILNAPTRTVRVRAQVPDPKGLLRPDMFLNVRIINDLGEKLAIPEDSVLHTGDQAYVFLMQGEGRFEPQPVTLGQKAGDYYVVLQGLSEGQTVVTGANFLIDSESKIRSVLVPKPKKESTQESNRVSQ